MPKVLRRFRRSGTKNKTAFLIPGQGFQQIGMGREEDGSPIKYLQEIIEEVKGVVEPIQVERVRYLMLADVSILSPEERKKLREEINRTDNAQLSLLLLIAALWREYETNEDNIMPSIVMGHSGGEPMAGYIAGAFDLPNVAKYVSARGHYMEVANSLYPGGMIVVSVKDGEIKLKTIERCLRGTDVEIANDNTPRQVVLSGRQEELEWVVSKLREKRFRASILNNVAGAYHHSTAMASVKGALDTLFSSSLITIRKPAIGWILNFSGTVEEDVKKLKVLLPAQVVNIVKCRQGIETAINLGVTEFVELGPGRGLTKMLEDFPTWQKIKVSKESTKS